MKKEIYYYIDESGSIKGDTEFFILGCTITDTPETNRKKINSLKNEIIEDIYFAEQIKDFKKCGFHACDNHFDIRAKYYSILPVLNYRSYILIIRKKTNYFNELIKKGLTDIDIYDNCINKLLFSRLQKNRKMKNILIFEQFGSKNEKRKQEINRIIESIALSIEYDSGKKPDYEIRIEGKEEELLSITDYVNYIFNQALEKEEIPPRMKQNYSLIKPNIGLVYLMHSDIFYHKNNELDIEKLKT